MKILADENIPLKSVDLLREFGHDVASVTLDSPGANDSDVLKRAVREERVLLTFDRDFGEMIYKRKLPAPPGIVYLRFIPLSPQEVAVSLLDILKIDGLNLERKLTIVERNRIRQRSLLV
jgi:predicted nuclease of predicted toxin-antitoxin system